MYDSYSDYYGMYDGPDYAQNYVTVGDEGQVYARPKTWADTDPVDYANFVIEVDAFRNRVQRDIEKNRRLYDQAIGGTKDAYRVFICQGQAALREPVDSWDDLEILKWHYNNGTFRTKAETEQFQMEYEMYQESLERQTPDYKTQHTAFGCLVTFLVLFGLPILGGLIGTANGESFIMSAFTQTFLALFLFPFAAPLAILIIGLAWASDGFWKFKHKKQGGLSKKAVIATAGVAAAMQASSTAKNVKSLMSEKKEV